MIKERKEALEKLCLQFRKDLIDLLYSIQTGHPGGSLSCCEIVTTLYQEFLNVDPKNPSMEGRDKFVMSKGHAAPMLYLNLAEKGFFPKEWLPTLRQLNSNLQGHPCAHKTPGVEVSTGPLGLGLGVGLGYVLADRIKGNTAYTYVLLGDGEIEEGAIWEAAMGASKFNAAHLIAILDNNGVQLDGYVEEIMPLGDIGAKWRAFGWNVICCDGHDIEDFANAVELARKNEGKPSIIIADTVKGKGISFMEGKHTWHGKAINNEDYAAAKRELEG